MGELRDLRDLGRYELLIELGRGGMAELFLGRLRGAGGFSKLVALKRILPHLAQDRRFTEMFLDEGRIASRLSHPNVCQVFELGDEGGVLYLAMEYLDGVSWDHLCAAERPEPRPIAGVLGQAAEGLHHAHTLRDLEGTPTPVIHRDVSPQNLFVTVDGVCKVLDFGVSKMMTDAPRTRSGVLKGKLPYMSPEQVRGEPLDGRSDVFALGVCAWEAFAGARLFDRETDYQIWKAITEDDAPPLRARWPACPPHLEAVIARALARDPARRYPTAHAFADELRGAVGFAAPAEIAAIVRERCGTRLAERARQVATALGRRGEPADARAVATEVEDAGETIDLRPGSIDQRPGATDRQPGATDRRPGSIGLRDRSIVVEQPGAIARQPGSIGLRDRSLVVARSAGSPAAAPARRRAGWPLALALAGAAVVVAVAIALAASRGEDPAELALARDAERAERAERAEPAEAEPAEPTEPAEPAEPAEPVTSAGSFEDSMQDLRDRLAGLREQLAASGGRAGATPRASTGRYRVDSRPEATIYANGRSLGETPVKVELAPGTYVMRAVLEDGREQTYTVEIEAGERLDSGRLVWW